MSEEKGGRNRLSKILLIDDEMDLLLLLKDSLERQGHLVWIAEDGELGMEKAMEQPDLILLDIMMPGLDGYEVCRKIRDVVGCPILFLSAKQAEADKIKGLALGGDDYITKPFSLKELLARIEAHLRREKRALLAHDSAGKKPFLSYGTLLIDLNGREVQGNGKKSSFTRKEFEIIELLALHPGQVFSKEQIYEKIWGYDAEGDVATVTEHIKNIRTKLAQLDPHTEYIKTVWGIGYRWDKKR